MIPIVYELKRALTSKTVIILTAVIILFSVGSAFATAAFSSPTTTTQGNVSYAYGYGNNTTYSFVVYVGNGYGQPIQGSVVNVSFVNGATLTPVSTDSNGYANFTATDINSTMLPQLKGTTISQAEYNFTTAFGSPSFTRPLEIFTNTSAPNQYFFQTISSVASGNGTFVNQTNNVSRFQLSSISIPNQATRTGLGVFYEGNLSIGSPSVKLYYLPMNTTSNGGINYQQAYNNATSEKNLTYYGTYSGFGSLNINPSNLTSSNDNYYMFALFTPNGTPLTVFPAVIQISSKASTSQVNSAFFGSEMSLLGLFVPLMAAVSAYMTYGKDRTGQVLESVLVRPVSRKGLISTRYLANTLAVFIAALISLVISSLVFEHYLGRALPLDTFAYGLWAVFVGIAGFVGLVYLASNFLKSQGALLGFAIAIFFVLDLFWSFLPIIPDLLAFEVMKLTSGTLPFAKFMIDMTYVTPTGFTALANYLVSGSTNFAYNVQGVTLAEQGVSTMGLVITGIVWIAIPLIIAIYAYTKRD